MVGCNCGPGVAKVGSSVCGGSSGLFFREGPPRPSLLEKSAKERVRPCDDMWQSCASNLLRSCSCHRIWHLRSKGRRPTLLFDCLHSRRAGPFKIGGCEENFTELGIVGVKVVEVRKVDMPIPPGLALLLPPGVKVPLNSMFVAWLRRRTGVKARLPTVEASLVGRSKGLRAPEEVHAGLGSLLCIPAHCVGISSKPTLAFEERWRLLGEGLGGRSEKTAIACIIAHVAI